MNKPRKTSLTVTFLSGLSVVGCALPAGNSPSSTASILPEKESHCLTGRDTVNAKGTVRHWLGGTAPLDCLYIQDGIPGEMIGFMEVGANSPGGKPIDTSDIARGMRAVLLDNAPEANFSLTHWDFGYRTPRQFPTDVHVVKTSSVSYSVDNGSGIPVPVDESVELQVSTTETRGRAGQQSSSGTLIVTKLATGAFLPVDRQSPNGDDKIVSIIPRVSKTASLETHLSP